MASSLDSSYQQAFDIEYDYNCTRCEEKGHHSEALFYCNKCNKLFCDTCVNLHGSYFTEHSVLGRKDIDQWGDPEKDVDMEMCDDHKGKQLDMYCSDHDFIGCYVCVSLHHRLCKKVNHVPEVAKDIHKNSEFKNLASDVAQMMMQLNGHVAGKTRNQKALQDICKNIISSIQDLKQRLVKLMDDLEKRTVEDLKTLLTEIDGAIQYDADACNAIHDDIKRLLELTQDKGKDNETLAFVGFNKCKTKISDAKDLLQSMTTQDYRIVFKPDSNIEQYLSSLESYGQFETFPSLAKGAAASTTVQEPCQTASTTCISAPSTSTVSPRQTTSDTSAPAEPPPVNSDHVYTMKSTKQYSVKMKGDKKCSITGCCTLPDGNIVIVDQVNQKVKLLNNQYNLIAHCRCESPLLYPVDVCHIADTEVAVSMNDGQKGTIQFINTENGKLVLNRAVQFEHDCHGLAHHTGHLYVGSRSALYMYTVAGQMVKKLYEQPSTSGSRSVYGVAVSDDKEKIYTTNIDKHCIITLDNNGLTLATLTELGWPRGVSVAPNRLVFVCDSTSHAVVQINRDGNRKLATRTTKKFGIGDPLPSCFNTKTTELVVGQFDNILVFKLK